MSQGPATPSLGLQVTKHIFLFPFIYTLATRTRERERGRERRKECIQARLLHCPVSCVYGLEPTITAQVYTGRSLYFYADVHSTADASFQRPGRQSGDLCYLWSLKILDPSPPPFHQYRPRYIHGNVNEKIRYPFQHGGLNYPIASDHQ